VSTLGVIPHWLRLRRSAGQPILAAAGFPAGDWPRARILAEPEEPTERRPGKIARPAKRHGRNQTTEEKTSTRGERQRTKTKTGSEEEAALRLPVAERGGRGEIFAGEKDSKGYKRWHAECFVTQ
jgi:hypothetical protein